MNVYGARQGCLRALAVLTRALAGQQGHRQSLTSCRIHVPTFELIFPTMATDCLGDQNILRDFQGTNKGNEVESCVVDVE